MDDLSCKNDLNESNCENQSESENDCIENSNEKIDHGKRDLLKFTAGAAGACCGIYALGKAVSYMSISDDALAESSVEVDISKLAKGETMTVVWRKAPVFIRNRTDEEVEKAKSENNSDLRDLETDQERTKSGKENILVVIGVCTHLGCIPIGKSNVYDGGEFGGWFCPCHGSHYDISGRIRKGPAPWNLEVPPYKFLSDTTILIGDN